MSPEWSGPNYGEHTEMSEVAPIVFDGSAADATTRLHNRRPKISERRLAILVRRARQDRNAGRIDKVTEAVHEIAVLGTQSLPPVERVGWTRVEVAWLVLFGLLAVALVVGAVLST